MEIFSYSALPGRQIEVYSSTGAFITPVIRHGNHISVVSIRLEPQGILGLHPAAADQLFMVTGGVAFISSDKMSEMLIEPGRAVLWKKGELHQTRAGEAGLQAIVIEAEGLAGSILMETSGSLS